MILNFGKYKGSSVHKILIDDFDYILWLVKNGFKLQPDDFAEFQAMASDIEEHGDSDDWLDQEFHEAVFHEALERAGGRLH